MAVTANKVSTVVRHLAILVLRSDHATVLRPRAF
jgi:hypothetical protein